MKSKIFIYSFLLSNLFFFGCDLFYEDTDSIGQANVKTLKILRQYEKDSDYIIVQNWLFDYHGEAQGHQTFITLAKWSFEEKQKFMKLLENLPKDKRQEFNSRYAFAVTDSGAKHEFQRAFDSIQSDLLSDIRLKIMQM